MDLEGAIALAAKSHKGQRDKSGMPYILHPLRVMLKMSTETEMIVAVLHDVVEDSSLSLHDLATMGVSEEILQAIDCLTWRKDESYDEFIERAQANPLSRKVKIADLEDNMDLKRLDSLTEKDVERLKKYHRVWLRLIECSPAR
ncbi:MAG: GTP pyrophosphokinase [Desulfomonilaceae bacterium]